MLIPQDAGENRPTKLGRFSVPSAFFFCHAGLSGRKGRMRMSGMAGIRPLISV